MVTVDGQSKSVPLIDRRRASLWISLMAWLLGATVLIIHVGSYPVLTYDDAFISLRYSRRLLEGRSLTWTDGLPVEGYSNLLWVLGCAFLAVLGVDILDTPVVLGIASSIAAIGAMVYAFAPRSWSDSLPAFAAALFLAVAGPIGLWAVSGLEGCLVAALLAWAVAFLRPLADAAAVDTKRAMAAGVPLALLCLTRPTVRCSPSPRVRSWCCGDVRAARFVRPCRSGSSRGLRHSASLRFDGCTTGTGCPTPPARRSH